MTLQQLRYLIAVAEYGSINAAANSLYASQSNLSTAIKDLESEFHITIFRRTNRGVSLTNEGHELLAYARQVIDQADMLQNRYAPSSKRHARLAISTQHYAFCVRAFINTVERCEDEDYDFVLRDLDDAFDFDANFGVSKQSLQIARTECYKDIATYLRKGLQQRREESEGEDRLEETLFFYPVKGAIHGLSNAIYHAIK